MTASLTQIQEGHSFNQFLNSLRSQATKKMYTHWLLDFMKYAKVDECDDLLKGASKEIQTQLIGYIMVMRGKGLKTSSINGRLSALRHFYEINDVENINWRKINRILKIDIPHFRRILRTL